MLKDGCIQGLGTHEELMRTCEAYREIARSQLRSDELEALTGAAGDAKDDEIDGRDAAMKGGE